MEEVLSAPKTAGAAAYEAWRVDCWPPWHELPARLHLRWERAAAEARAFGAPDLSPPWIIFGSREDGPLAILAAGRPGEVAKVRGMPEQEVEALVQAANAFHLALVACKFKRIEVDLAALTKRISAALAAEDDAAPVPIAAMEMADELADLVEPLPNGLRVTEETWTRDGKPLPKGPPGGELWAGRAMTFDNLPTTEEILAEGMRDRDPMPFVPELEMPPAAVRSIQRMLVEGLSDRDAAWRVDMPPTSTYDAASKRISTNIPVDAATAQRLIDQGWRVVDRVLLPPEPHHLADSHVVPPLPSTDDEP